MATKENTTELPENMRIESIPKARRGRKSYVWEARLAPVMTVPGKEVRVYDGFKSAIAASRAATSLKQGRLSIPQSEGEWKFVTRTITVDENGDLTEPGHGEQRFALYAIFNPNK